MTAASNIERFDGTLLVRLSGHKSSLVDKRTLARPGPPVSSSPANSRRTTKHPVSPPHGAADHAGEAHDFGPSAASGHRVTDPVVGPGQQARRFEQYGRIGARVSADHERGIDPLRRRSLCADLIGRSGQEPVIELMRSGDQLGRNGDQPSTSRVLSLETAGWSSVM